MSKSLPAARKDKAGNERRHYSNWLITVNTNYRPKDDTDAEAVATELEVAANRFLQLGPIIECLERAHSQAHVTTPLEHDIIRIEVPTASIELGTNTRGQRVHLHAYIKVVHRTNLQLNQKDIQQFFREALVDDPRIKNVYVNVRWVPATDEITRDYIEKHSMRIITAQAPSAAAAAMPDAQ